MEGSKVGEDYDTIVKENIVPNVLRHIEEEERSAIQVVIGIPFYTEITNITSVLVSLSECFSQKEVTALVVVLGEFQTLDQLSKIPISQISTTEQFCKIRTFWKPSSKFAGKPYSVRAFQWIEENYNCMWKTELRLVGVLTWLAD
eukprot:TRINITY_DN9617_c0_g1_i1.p1 TRINITY_DN9617_c0_g1~~TRINITY_DN9617_c0_g1_i1.p1  ORF type:complete len:145 (-),score=20.08 TRINITY_DN9617_c0_g1_i1:58-492(-)